MRKNLSNRMIGVSLAVSLAFATTSPLVLASEDTQTVDPKSTEVEKPAETEVQPENVMIGSIEVKDKASFGLKHIQLLPEQGSNMITFALSIKNETNEDLLLIDYIPRLKDKSGRSYSARPLPHDRMTSKIQAHTSNVITYYAEVDETNKLSDLALELYEWDFSAPPKYERKLGDIVVPESYSGASPAGEEMQVSVDGIPMSIKVTHFQTIQNEKYYNPNIFLELNNVGKKKLKTPEYQFAIHTPDDTVFPLELKAEPSDLSPLDTLEWRLTGSIPVAAGDKGWKLIVIGKLNDTKVLPAAVFELPGSPDKPGDDTGTGNSDRKYMFSTNSGIYTAKLGAMYRAPWEDQDVISSEVLILNEGEDSISVPDLAAYYLLDNKVKVAANVVQTTATVGIAPSSSAKMYISGKIPFDQKFSSIKLVLQEKEAENKLSDVLTFASVNKLDAIRNYRASDSYRISEPGRNLTYRMIGNTRYEGTVNDIAVIQLEVENSNSRPASINSLVASVNIGYGNTYPAKVSSIKNKISPQGKALIEIWSVLPKNYQSSNLSVLIGDAISEGKLVEGEAKPDGMINPVSFWAPDEKTELNNALNKLEIYPYTMAITNLDTYSEDTNFSLKFDYSITKESQVEANLEDHKLVIMVDDTKGYKWFEASYKVSELEQGASSGSGQSGDNVLKLGKHKFKVQIPNPDPLPNESSYRAGNLYIYDEFQGHRRLLAKKENLAFSIKTESSSY